MPSSSGRVVLVILAGGCGEESLDIDIFALPNLSPLCMQSQVLGTVLVAACTSGLNIHTSTILFINSDNLQDTVVRDWQQAINV